MGDQVKGGLVPRSGDLWYAGNMTKEQVKEIVDRVLTWPDEDQEELAQVAREIEARRTSVYVLSDDEKAAIDEARRGGIASDDEVRAFWSRHGLA